jgi:phage baseplate assembly protein V
MSDPADIQRMIGELIRIGVVVSVDLEGCTCRLDVGEAVTGDVPFGVGRAGKTSVWSPVTVGEQRLLFCPEADLTAAVLGPALYSDANPAPGNRAGLDLVRFGDTGEISYDAEANLLELALPANARVVIKAEAGVSIEAAGGLRFKGSARFSDNLSAGNGASGTFTTPTGQVVIVQDGIVTAID